MKKQLKEIQGQEVVKNLKEHNNCSPDIQTQENPYTTAEGVKRGEISRITPKVVPEKVLTPSLDKKEVEDEINILKAKIDELKWVIKELEEK